MALWLWVVCMGAFVSIMMQADAMILKTMTVVAAFTAAIDGSSSLNPKPLTILNPNPKPPNHAEP